MKLPNGYGTVYKLSGKRRKPYIARITIGWEFDEKTEKKKQIIKTIGCFRTKKEGLQALAEYNNNPYDLSMSEVTFAEMYELWAKEKFDENTNRSTYRNYLNAYNHCKALQDMKMTDIRPRHLQAVLDEHKNLSQSALSRMRSMLNQLYKWCIKNDYIKKNCAEALIIKSVQGPKPKDAFTSEEIKTLWELQENETAKILLILIYSGCRIGELLGLKKSELEIERQMFNVVKSKTESGVRRVPIADKVFPLWQYFLSVSECNYVFTAKRRKEQLKYFNFKDNFFAPFREAVGFSHTIHETRHTCISQLTQQHADERLIKIIVGHKSAQTLTEKVYTHIEDAELLKTINLIP